MNPEPTTVQPTTVEALTALEMRVLIMLADGLTNQQIGNRLGVSDKSVAHLVTDVRTKLDAVNRTHAVSIGYRRGLLT